MYEIITITILAGLFVVDSWKIYKLRKRVMSLDAALSSLIKRIRESEQAINTNFEGVTKRFKKVENEINDIHREEVSTKEAIKVANRVQRLRDTH
jgi:hypothetical protein